MSTYTAAQVEAYLERINYPPHPETETTRLQHLQKSIENDPLATLSILQRHHLGSIPWGNTAIHYSQHHSISTHPSAVFEKLVLRRLDGYCMENTNLLFGVLRSLGYQAYPAAGRVSSAANDPKNAGPDVRYSALSHMVIITTIHNKKYMVDVGFGSNNPTHPLPLEESAISTSIPPTQMRLAREPLPEAVDQSQRFWIYQIRFHPESHWVPLYAFSETESLPQDFAIMNFYTSQMPSSWFTQMVVCVKHFLDERGEELQGLYVLAGGEVKRRKAMGGSEVVQRLEREEDRVRALERWFGVRLADHEVVGIRGLGSEIK
ncbi:hypothetical protein BJX61DRAFT_361902 [Aspergillus egyptiacus]|nr:hypothetical protein BJX61DRAFT_361902 [Aspergillus egyptiacus]